VSIEDNEEAKRTVSSESEDSDFFSLKESAVAVAAAESELSTGAVRALADLKRTASSESEDSDFLSLKQNDVAVAAAEVSTGAVLA